LVLIKFLVGFLTWGAILWMVYGRYGVPFLGSLRGSAREIPGGRLFVPFFLLGEVLIQGLWVAYCASRSMAFVEVLGKPTAYGLGFLACQVPLAMVARSQGAGEIYHVLRSVIPMGLFPAFVLHPQYMAIYAWALGRMG
jgi:hypothetical protein